MVDGSHDLLRGEMRNASRFAREAETDFARLWLGPDEAPRTVEVHDESLGGLSVCIDESFAVQVGDHVGIEYSGTNYRCRVCHITAGPQGRTVMGLSCDEEAPFSA